MYFKSGQIDQQIWFQSEWFLTGSSLSPVLGKAYIGSCWVLGGHCENKIKIVLKSIQTIKWPGESQII